jgi:hypothetical protein
MLLQEPQLRLSDVGTTHAPPQETVLPVQVEATLHPERTTSATESSKL